MVGYAPPPMLGLAPLGTFGPVSEQSTLHIPLAGAAGAAYPLANLALYVPFSVAVPVTAYEGWVVCGTGGGGNFDIGVYSAAGSRISSAGATARSASALANTTALSDTVLAPGIRYYLAFACDGTTNFFSNTPAAGICEALGILESTTSYVLPASPTLSRTTRAYIPHFGLNFYTVSL